jgi:hypothetical protein
MQLMTCHAVLTACNATGTDTTAHSLSRAAISMAKYPEWLEKIWEEQQSIIATEGEAITPEVRMYRMCLPCQLECCTLLRARALKEWYDWLRMIYHSSTGYLDSIDPSARTDVPMLFIALLVNMTHGRDLCL